MQSSQAFAVSLAGWKVQMPVVVAIFLCQRGLATAGALVPLWKVEGGQHIGGGRSYTRHKEHHHNTTAAVLTAYTALLARHRAEFKKYTLADGVSQI